MAEISDNTLELHLAGPLKLDDITAADFGAFVGDVERLVNSRVDDEMLREKILSLKVSVVGVKEGSAIAVFAPSPRDAVFPVVASTIADIESGRVEDWSARSKRLYYRIMDLATKIGARPSFKAKWQGEVLEADLAKVVAPPQLFDLKGTTTLYGKVYRLGGKEPKVDIEPLGYTRMVHAAAPEALVKELEQSESLYTLVAITGEASWSPTTLEITHFVVKTWRPFVPVPPVEGFEQLRERYGRYYNDIDDVTAWLAELRGEDIE